MKYHFHAADDLRHRVGIAYIADVETHPVVAQPATEVVLFRLVAAEDANLVRAGVQQVGKHCLSEGARTTGDREPPTGKFR
jgi:hypothetical protein